MSAGPAGRALFVLLLTGLRLSAAEPDFDPAALGARARMLRPVVEDILGQSPGESVTVVVATPETLRDSVAADMVATHSATRDGPRGAALARACAGEARLAADDSEAVRAAAHKAIRMLEGER